MQVTVHFIGICTHIDNLLPYLSRVVLVDASAGMNVAQAAIAPHTAMLYIPSQFIAAAPPSIYGLTPSDADSPPQWWTMSSVQMQLSNTTGKLTRTCSYCCLPSLSQIAGPTELELSRRVVEAGGAACEFRITAGELDCYTNGSAVFGKLTVETSAPPQLIVTRIWDQKVATITLRKPERSETDPVIFLGNTGDDETDADFLLHYGVTTWTPDRLLTPRKTEGCEIRPATKEELAALAMVAGRVGGMTIGCSNSVYP